MKKMGNEKLLEFVDKHRRPLKIDRTKYAFYPSEIAYCRRKMFYKIYGIEETNPSDYINIMELGDMGHEYIVEGYKRAGIWVGDEIDGKVIVKGIPFSFRVDLFINWEDEILPVEIKTVSTWKYKKYSFEDYPQHLAQLQMYLNILGYEKGLIHILNRDNGQQKIITVEKDEGLFNDLMGRLNEFVDDVQNKNVPEKEVSYLCKYCGYKDLCDSNMEQTKALLKEKELPYMFIHLNENVQI